MKAFIEIEPGSFDKWEYDESTDQFRLDRKLEIPYPASYGYLLDTEAPDGDALDVFVVGSALRQGSWHEVFPLYLITCIDNGVKDDKLVVQRMTDNSFVPYTEQVEAIVEFLSKYKKGFEVIDVLPAVEAHKAYEEAKK